MWLRDMNFAYMPVFSMHAGSLRWTRVWKTLAVSLASTLQETGREQDFVDFRDEANPGSHLQ